MLPAELDPERFADSLLAMAQATGSVAQIEQDLGQCVDFLRQQESLRRFLADPAVRQEGKRQAVADVLRDRVHPDLQAMLLILVTHNAFLALPEVADAFYSRVSRLKQEQTGELVSAQPLAPERVAQIEEETGRILGKTVRLRTRVDAGVLGGFYLKVGDFVIDDTLERRLERFRRNLLS